MKKLFTLLISGSLILSVFTFSSCNDSGIPISIPQTIEYVFQIPASPDSNFIISKIVTGNVDSMLATQNANRDDVESIAILGVGVGEVDSTGSFLPQASWFQLDTTFIYIGDPSKSFLTDSLIGYVPYLYSLTQDQNGFVAMSMISTEFDIVPFIIKPTYRVSVFGKSKLPLTTTKYYKVRLNTSFRIFM
jgi:hypothetical protein